MLHLRVYWGYFIDLVLCDISIHIKNSFIRKLHSQTITEKLHLQVFSFSPQIDGGGRGEHFGRRKISLEIKQTLLY